FAWSYLEKTAAMCHPGVMQSLRQCVDEFLSDCRLPMRPAKRRANADDWTAIAFSRPQRPSRRTLPARPKKRAGLCGPALVTQCGVSSPEAYGAGNPTTRVPLWMKLPP